MIVSLSFLPLFETCDHSGERRSRLCFQSEPRVFVENRKTIFLIYFLFSRPQFIKFLSLIIKNEIQGQIKRSRSLSSYAFLVHNSSKVHTSSLALSIFHLT